MTKDKLIEKIKSLLALASSPNEHEAELAMRRAQELMAKYCIEECELQYNKQEFVIESATYTPKIRMGTGLLQHLPIIATTIAPIFGCQATFTKLTHTIKLWGFRTNLAVCEYAIDALLNQGYADYKREYAKQRSLMFDHNFWSGFAIGIDRKFKKASEESKAIVVYDKVEEYMQKNFKQAVMRTSAAALAGIESGKSAVIYGGISAATQGNLLR